MSALTTLDTVLEIPARVTGQEMETKEGHKDWKGKTLSLLADYLTVYVENLKESTKQTPRTNK